MIKLGGSIVALPTPFLKSVEIDFEALERLIEWHIASGTDAIVVNGSTGEGHLLEENEQRALFKASVATARGRIPVIAGTGCISTAQTIALTRVAQEAGVDALLIVTPFYVKPSQEALYQHYKKLSVYADLPIILYNVPGRTGVDMLPDTVARVAQLRHVVGLKEAVPGLKRLQQLRARVSEDFLIFSGEDQVACDWILKGASGVISVTANVAPVQMKAMVTAALKKSSGAKGLNEVLQALHLALFVESNPVPTKFALWKMHKMNNVLRLPLMPLNRQHYDEVVAALEKTGVL